MEVSQQDLLKIVEQASTLSERLGNCFVPNEAEDNDKLTMSRLKTWCQAVTQGNPEKLAKRLIWDNLDVSTMVRVLGAVRLADEQQLPIWTETLREALQTDWETAYASTYRCLETEKPIPFEEVYLPFVYVARQKLIAQVNASLHLLPEAVHLYFERQLLLKLASLFAQSLEFEFLQFKAVKQSASMSLLEQKQGSHSNMQYHTFVKDLTTGGLLSFFQKYSVLAQLVATAMDFWVEEKAEFLQRLSSDLPSIQQNFQESTGQVVEIQGNFSDSHNQGRSVMALTFASGLKLVYKPRGLALESAYFQLLAWCNQHFVEMQTTSLHPFKILKVINSTTHGWMEYVEHLPCENEAAVQRYYQRAGMILCLLYVLQGNDCHEENLIASGEHPVLVDLETLVHPRAREVNPTEEVGAQSLVNQQFFQDSVLRTGLLPRWEFGADGGTPHDISGLGGAGGEIPFRMQKWQNINTDNMALEYEPDIMPPSANIPLLNGIILSSHDYVNEIVDGFRQMYQFLAQRREELLATDSPIAALAHQKVRFLFRNTQVYSHVLGKTLHPKFLQHGVDRSIELDVLSRAFLAADEKPPIWSILGVELQAMEQMDIPYFVADSSSDALTLNSGLIVKGYFREPSYNQMISCLQQLNDTDLVQQIAIIRGSFYSRVARGMASSLPTERASASPNLDIIALLTPAQLVQEAVEIAKELQQRAIYAANGSATWIGMTYLPKAERMQLQPLSDGLYDGVCGVSLFLAALAKVTGDAGFRDLALSTLQDLRKTLQDTQDPNTQRKITKQTGIGGGIGLGSIVYTLVRVSQFLDEPELLDTASLAASLITQESIANDRSFDTIAGAAGAILGLLSLYQAHANPVILNQAQALGYHLLNNRTTSETGFRAWATLEGKLATGISHGAAGIAYALLRLYKTTQDPVFLEAAEEAIAYERSVFSPTDGNWPDVRNFSLNKSKPSFMTTWCHGAPGIGLARLGSLMILDTAEIRQEIAVAINTTQHFGLHNIDHLCCGNFGRMEVLLVGACKLSRPDLWNTVQKQAARVVARAKHVGSFSLFSELPGDVYNPGFFQGSAGIGYELLRLAYPESLPSVLLWE